MSALRLTGLAVSLLALGVAFAAPIAAEPPPAPLPELRFDPFAPPELGEGTAADPAGAFVPVLRGTLVSGEGSLANLGGIVLRIGQEAEGWRLVEVGPFQATFERGGQLVVLDVDGEVAR